MKTSGLLTLSLSLSLLIAAEQASGAGDEADSKDAHGKSVGGMTGMMVGAIGGPIGLLVGAGVGMLLGDGVEDVAETHLLNGEQNSSVAPAATSGETLVR